MNESNASNKSNKMMVTAIVLDEMGEIVHRSQMPVSPIMLTVASESRQEMARMHGPDWTAGAVSFFGREVLQALRPKQPQQRDIDLSVMNLAMSVWVFDSVYGGLSAEALIGSDLTFTISHDGTVRHDRISV